MAPVGLGEPAEDQDLGGCGVEVLGCLVESHVGEVSVTRRCWDQISLAEGWAKMDRTMVATIASAVRGTLVRRFRR